MRVLLLYVSLCLTFPSSTLGETTNWETDVPEVDKDTTFVYQTTTTTVKTPQPTRPPEESITTPPPEVLLTTKSEVSTITPLEISMTTTPVVAIATTPPEVVITTLPPPGVAITTSKSQMVESVNVTQNTESSSTTTEKLVTWNTTVATTTTLDPRPPSEPMKTDYFNLDALKMTISADEITQDMISPEGKLLPFKTINEIEIPTDLLYGRFHGFSELLKIPRSKLVNTRRAIASVVYYLQTGTFILLDKTNPASQNESIHTVLNWWRYFYLCMITHDFRSMFGPCTDGFVFEKGKRFVSYMDWNPERDIALLPLKHDMLLVLFNLAMCQHFYNSLPFFCPSTCLGRLKPGLKDEDDLPSEIGNPCELVRNTRTIRCSSRRAWSVYIHQLFLDLVNPSTMNRWPGENFLNWLTEEGGYVCDCADRHRWVDTSMQCEATAEWGDKCGTNTSSRLGPCERNGTFQCITDQNTGDAFCECNVGYYGVRCTDKLDACKMSLVTYEFENPRTGRYERKTASGNTMCNVNMSGTPIPRRKTAKGGESDDDETPGVSKCISSPGTLDYLCKCEIPFMEDPQHPKPNCFKRIGPCNKRLCLHGTCVASSEGASSTSVCVCNPGYDGPLCEHKADHWSPWSECLPVCGLNRTRTRRRSTAPREPSTWKRSFDDLSGIKNKMSDMDMLNYPGELIQAEICPPRTGVQCPFSPSSADYQAMAAWDPGLLELDAFISLAITALILAVGISSFIARVVRGLEDKPKKHTSSW